MIMINYSEATFDNRMEKMCNALSFCNAYRVDTTLDSVHFSFWLSKAILHWDSIGSSMGYRHVDQRVMCACLNFITAYDECQDITMLLNMEKYIVLAMEDVLTVSDMFTKEILKEFDKLKNVRKLL